MTAPSSWTKLLAIPFGVALLWQTGCVCGPGPNQGGYDDESKDPPKSLQGVKFVESEKGVPEVVGCADGQREGFADITKHKRIAGCLARWEGVKSLRDKPTGKACGDDGDVCPVPADACSPGWHICGMDSKNTDLKGHTSWRACEKETGPGKFVAGMSHGQTDELCPPPPTAATEFPCMESGIGSEPVCCGDDCQYGKCRDGVWRGKTKISLGKAEGCGAVTSERNGGVLCCFDGAGDPVDPNAPAGTPPVADTGGPAPAGESGGPVEGNPTVPSGPPAGAAPTGAVPDSTVVDSTVPSTLTAPDSTKGAAKPKKK